MQRLSVDHLYDMVPLPPGEQPTVALYQALHGWPLPALRASAGRALEWQRATAI